MHSLFENGVPSRQKELADWGVPRTVEGALVAPVLTLDPAVACLAHDSVFAAIDGADVVAATVFGAPLILDVLPARDQWDRGVEQRLQDRAVVVAALGGRHGVLAGASAPAFVARAERATALLASADSVKGRPGDSDVVVHALVKAGGHATVRMIADQTGLDPKRVWRALTCAALRGAVLIDTTRHLDGETLVVGLGSGPAWAHPAWANWSALALLAPGVKGAHRAGGHPLASGLAVPYAAISVRHRTPRVPWGNSRPRPDVPRECHVRKRGKPTFPPVIETILAAAAERLADGSRNRTVTQAANWAVMQIHHAAEFRGGDLPIPSMSTIRRRLLASRRRRD